MRTEDHGLDRGWYHHLSSLLVLPNNRATHSSNGSSQHRFDSHDWFRQSSRSTSLELGLLRYYSLATNLVCFVDLLRFHSFNQRAPRSVYHEPSSGSRSSISNYPRSVSSSVLGSSNFVSTRFVSPRVCATGDSLNSDSPLDIHTSRTQSSVSLNNLIKLFRIVPTHF